MGNKSWTTDRQRKFLMDNIPQYEAAQQKKKTRLWLEKLFDQYIAMFPVVVERNSPTLEQLIELLKRVSSNVHRHNLPY